MLISCLRHSNPRHPPDALAAAAAAVAAAAAATAAAAGVEIKRK